MKQMHEAVRKVSFVHCPRCFWLVTYFKKNKKNKSNCPRCGTRPHIQTVIVKLRIEETIEEGGLNEEITNNMKFDGKSINPVLTTGMR